MVFSWWLGWSGGHLGGEVWKTGFIQIPLFLFPLSLKVLLCGLSCRIIIFSTWQFKTQGEIYQTSSRLDLEWAQHHLILGEENWHASQMKECQRICSYLYFTTYGELNDKGELCSKRPLNWGSAGLLWAISGTSLYFLTALWSPTVFFTGYVICSTWHYLIRVCFLLWTVSSKRAGNISILYATVHSAVSTETDSQRELKT